MLSFIRYRIIPVSIMLALIVLCSGTARALDPVNVVLDAPVLDLTQAIERYRGEGDRIQVSTAPASDGIVRRIEVRAKAADSSPHWAVVALANNTDEQVDRLLVATHYRLVGSGFFWPDLGATRIASLTPSQGFRPESQKDAQADVFLITLDPGTVVTFVMEMPTARLPQLYLWEPNAYKDHVNALTLYQGIVIGVAGLLALFLTILFVVKGSVMFPAAAALGWAVLIYIGIDFGFWGKVFDLSPAAEQVWRASGEAILAATLLVFLVAYLNLNRWSIRYMHVTGVWLAVLSLLAVTAVYDPAITAGLSRLCLFFIAIAGLGLILWLCVHGYDRAVMLVPTWGLFTIWVIVCGLTIGGIVINDVVAPSLLGGLVLIVMLIGFTVMQHAFSSGSVMQGPVSEVERRALALTGSGDMIWDWDVVSDHIYITPELEQLLGLKRGTLEGEAAKWLSVLHSADSDLFRAGLDGLIEQRRGRLTQAFRLKSRDGQYLWFQLKARPVVGADGEVVRCVGTLTDVTEVKTAEERLLHDAVHDQLTGLPNRHLFLDRLDAALVTARLETGRRPAILVIDIDRFRQVNDSVGVAVGDSILLTVARRLGRLLKPQDTLGRLTADQFGLVLVSERDSARITAFAESVRKTLRAPIHFGDREIFLTASIGMVIVETPTLKRDDLLKDAELAMQHAKRIGGDRIEVFKAAMRQRTTDRLMLESDMRRAVEREELKMLYQPIVRLEDRSVVGFELLMRWDHPKLGRLTPIEFIPIAEASGLINELGLYALDRAARQLALWQRLVPVRPPLFLSVNVSSRQLLRHDLLQDLRSIFSRHDVRRGTLKLELTESMVMENPEFASQLLSRIRDLGAGLSIDDFGTGYSSLAYLQRFPFDTLKVDKTFVRPTGKGERPVILRSILALAQALNLDVVAEGVESDSDAIELYQMGCEYAQGYAFGQPMTASECNRILNIRETNIKKG